MDQSGVFSALMLIARPAAGKSEIIDFLKKAPISERMQTFHVGNFSVMDDFPMLWTWFEEDDILTRLGHPRLHTKPGGAFIGVHMWDLLMERLCMDYKKFKRDNPSVGKDTTAIIEFSRGLEHGGYERAFNHLHQELLQDVAIIYIDVSWEESLRKNRKRFNPDKPDSILEHGLTDEKLESLYKYTDWMELTSNCTEYLVINSVRVPFVNFDNHDDITTKQGKGLGDRLKITLDALWNNYQ
jgi:hypothetical protein